MTALEAFETAQLAENNTHAATDAAVERSLGRLGALQEAYG